MNSLKTEEDQQQTKLINRLQKDIYRRVSFARAFAKTKIIPKPPVTKTEKIDNENIKKMESAVQKVFGNPEPIVTPKFSTTRTVKVNKVGCAFPMVIWSEFRMGQYRDDDHREDAPHFCC